MNLHGVPIKPIAILARKNFAAVKAFELAPGELFFDRCVHSESAFMSESNETVSRVVGGDTYGDSIPYDDPDLELLHLA